MESKEMGYFEKEIATPLKRLLKYSRSRAIVDVRWGLISITMSSLVQLLLRIILGRDLGTEGLGIYSLAFTIYLLGMMFSAFGITSALTKYIAEFIDDHTKICNYVSSGMTSSIITGSIMGLVFFLLAPFIAISLFHTPELESMIQLVALCFPFIAIQKAVLGTLNGHRKMKFYALLNIAQNVSVVVMSIILVIPLGMGVMGAVIGLVVPTIVVSALSPILIRDNLRFDHSLWNVPALRATTVFGFYAVLANTIGYLNSQVDSISLGYFMNPTDVGIYAVAILLAQTLTLIPGAVSLVTGPATATMYGKGNIEGVRRLFNSTLKKSLLVSIGSALIIAIAGPFIIVLVFTEQYLASYIPLLILLVGFAIGASFGAVGTTLSSIGKVHIVFRISAVCALLNIALNIVLVPHLGMNGAAIATSVSMIMSFVITVSLIRNYLGIRRHDIRTTEIG